MLHYYYIHVVEYAPHFVLERPLYNSIIDMFPPQIENVVLESQLSLPIGPLD